MSDLELRIIKSYLELPAESRKKFEEFVVALSEEQKEQAANLASELQPETEKENKDEIEKAMELFGLTENKRKVKNNGKGK